MSIKKIEGKLYLCILLESNPYIDAEYAREKLAQLLSSYKPSFSCGSVGLFVSWSFICGIFFVIHVGARGVFIYTQAFVG